MQLMLGIFLFTSYKFLSGGMAQLKHLLTRLLGPPDPPSTPMANETLHSSRTVPVQLLFLLPGLFILLIVMNCTVGITMTVGTAPGRHRLPHLPPQLNVTVYPFLVIVLTLLRCCYCPRPGSSVDT